MISLVDMSCSKTYIQEITVTPVYPQGRYSIDTTLAISFQKAIAKTKNSDSFIFFTDPHLLQQGDYEMYSRCNDYLYLVRDYHLFTGCTFVLCGGDWLGNSDWPNQAIDKLAYSNYITHQLFGDSYIPVLGNHDTNYQGYSSVGEFVKGELSLQEYVNAYMPRIGSSYYSINMSKTMLYILDSYTDWNRSITPYREEQLEWLASRLFANDNAHSAVCLHIYFENSSGSVSPFGTRVSDIILAYNKRRSLSVGEKVYDFRNSTGHVEYILCGHLHEDLNCMLDDGTPVIATDDMRSGPRPTFDLVNINYDEKIMSLFRVGEGENRYFSLKH